MKSRERLLIMTEPRKETRRTLQTALLALMDAAIACLSLVLALQIYYDMKPPETLTDRELKCRLCNAGPVLCPECESACGYGREYLRRKAAAG